MIHALLLLACIFGLVISVCAIGAIGFFTEFSTHVTGVKRSVPAEWVLSFLVFLIATIYLVFT